MVLSKRHAGMLHCSKSYTRGAISSYTVTNSNQMSSSRAKALGLPDLDDLVEMIW